MLCNVIVNLQKKWNDKWEKGIMSYYGSAHVWLEILASSKAICVELLSRSKAIGLESWACSKAIVTECLASSKAIDAVELKL